MVVAKSVGYTTLPGRRMVDGAFEECRSRMVEVVGGKKERTWGSTIFMMEKFLSKVEESREDGEAGSRFRMSTSVRLQLRLPHRDFHEAGVDDITRDLRVSELGPASMERATLITRGKMVKLVTSSYL
jgi:hypothetical protein